MSLKEERERRAELYGQKVTGIRAFFSFWCPLIAVLYISNIADYVMNWNGNALGFVFDLLICFLALSSAILGRFWEKEAFISSMCFLSAFLIRITWNFISILQSVGEIYATMNSAVDSINPGGIGGIITSAASAGLGLGAGIMMASAIISFLFYAVFIGAYTAIFVKHRTMFIAPISVLRGDEQWD